MPAIKMSRVISVLALVTCLTNACSGGGETPFRLGATTGSGMNIQFRFATEPPVFGANTFEVVVKKDGAPVSDATVTARFTMPAMPSMNMPEMHSEATLDPLGDGRYRGVGQLLMTGTWNVRIHVTRGGSELGASTLSIVAM